MAGNTANLTPGQQAFVAGEGIEIADNVISNTMLPPSAILDNTITDPTTITDFGGAYIVPATGATGAWAGQANQIATTTDNGVNWSFAAPTSGMRRQVIGGTNAGTVYRWSGTAWAPVVGGGQPAGTILKSQYFEGTEITVSATAGFTTCTLTASYTPVSAKSHIYVEVDVDYQVAGSAADAWRGTLAVGGTNIRSKVQTFANAVGGGTRSSVLAPTSGRYTNTSTTAKAITFLISRASGDDTASLNGNTRSFRVTEVQR